MLCRKRACVLSQRNGWFNATSKSDDTDNYLADKQLELRMWWNLRNLYHCERPTKGTLGWLIFTRIIPELGLKTSAPTLASLVSLYAIYLSTATKVDVCNWGTFLSAPPSRRIWNSSGRCLANPACTLFASWFLGSYDSERWEYNYSENTPWQSQSPKSAPSGSKVIKHRKEARYERHGICKFTHQQHYNYENFITCAMSTDCRQLQIECLENSECDVAVKHPFFWLQWSSPPTKDRTINVTNSHQLKSLKSISLESMWN